MWKSLSYFLVFTEPKVLPILGYTIGVLHVTCSLQSYLILS